MTGEVGAEESSKVITDMVAILRVTGFVEPEWPTADIMA